MISETTAMNRLRVMVVEARLTRDTETFGKMDPFIEIKHQGKTHSTPAHQDGGKTPKWGHTLELSFESEKETVELACLDEDILKN